MSIKTFNIKTDSLEKGYLSVINSFLHLSTKELQLASVIMQNNNTLDSTLRKKLISDLNISSKHLSQYIFFLSKKGIIVKEQGKQVWKIADKVGMNTYEDKITITINVLRRKV